MKKMSPCDLLNVDNVSIFVALDDDNKPWFDVEGIAICAEYYYASSVYHDLLDDDICLAEAYGARVLISKRATLEALRDAIGCTVDRDCKKIINAIEKWCKEKLG
ncbi:hypothetical protein [Devriesea agamarum]|uniref:hypothetical protein n=1 Tax=Devriesea agamarum TaxID=472569 RepID=UPI00071C9955|nr:hypothetical protein [Devriesea agamarum]